MVCCQHANKHRDRDQRTHLKQQQRQMTTSQVLQPCIAAQSFCISLQLSEYQSAILTVRKNRTRSGSSTNTARPPSISKPIKSSTCKAAFLLTLLSAYFLHMGVQACGHSKSGSGQVGKVEEVPEIPQLPGQSMHPLETSK